MKLSICEIETYQFVKSTPSKFQSARLKTVQFVKSINWYFQVLIIRQNETFSLCNLNFSICQVNQSTYSSGINLTQWNFKIVELKLFNVSNWQIEVFQFYLFNQIKDSKYHIETLEFVASTYFNDDDCFYYYKWCIGLNGTPRHGAQPTSQCHVPCLPLPSWLSVLFMHGLGLCLLVRWSMIYY